MKKVGLRQPRNNKRYRFVLLMCFLLSNTYVFSQEKINIVEAYYMNNGMSGDKNYIALSFCECCCPYFFITLQMNKSDIDSAMLRSYADFEKNGCFICPNRSDTVFYTQVAGIQKKSLCVICGIDVSDSTVAIVRLFGEAYDVQALYRSFSMYENDLRHNFKRLKRKLMEKVKLYYKDNAGQLYEITIPKVIAVTDEKEKDEVTQRYW